MAMSRDVWEPGMKNGRGSAVHHGHTEPSSPGGKGNDEDSPAAPGSAKPGQPGSMKPGQPGSMKPGQPGAPKPNRPGAPKPGRPGKPEPDPSDSTRPDPSTAQRLTRFEGMSLKLRKTASGRYALGVDIELGVDAAKPGRPKPGRPDGDEGMPDDDELEAGAEGEDEGEDEDERDLAKDDDKAGFAAKGFDDGDDEDDDAFAADDDSDDELSLAAEDDAAEDEDVDVVEDDVVEDDVELSLAAEDDNDDELSLAAEDDDDELSLAAEDDERAEDKDEDDEGSAPPRWPNRYPVRPGIQEVSQAPALFHDPDDDEDDDEDGDDTADAEPAPRAMARSARATPLAARAAPAKPAPAKPAPEKPAPEKPAPTKRTPAVALKKMLDAARKTIGMREYPPRSDHNKITQWYHNHIDKRIGDGAWCNMAVTYWAGHSGNLAAIFGGKRIGYAYTIYHAQKFQKKGRWHKGVAGIKPGDIVFYAWKGPLTVTNIDHVGIVEKVKGKKIVTIEGNSSDQCARRVRDSKYIVGYGRPIYGK